MRTNSMQTLLTRAVLAAAAFSASAVHAAEPTQPTGANPLVPATNTVAPATQPASPEVAALIKQLGDESYARREEAATALKKIGKQAIPALTQASSDANPQIRTSSQALISEIRGEDKPKPSTADALSSNQIQVNGGMIRIQGGGNVRIQNLRVGGPGVARMQVQMVVNGNATRDMTVEENGRKVHIHEDNDGIKMQVTENDKTTETNAKNADDLKKQDPEAFKLYEKYNANGVGEIKIEPELRK